MFELRMWHDCEKSHEFQLVTECDIYELPIWNCPFCGTKFEGDDGVLMVEFDEFTDSIEPKNYKA